MNDIRRNSITGVIETEGLTKVNLHFSEWWNGEGMDFDFDDKKKICLHLDEMHALAVALVATGYIDVEAVQEEADDLNQKAKLRADMLQKHIQKYGSIANADW